MSTKSAAPSQSIFPTLRYADASSAIDWLEKAFGFTRKIVIPGPDGTVAHAELTLQGGGMIMLGSCKEDTFRYRVPREVGGVTQASYFYIADIDPHFARARAAGAEIVRALQDTDYGSREYSARDPEGHLWHFGTYLPDASEGVSQTTEGAAAS